MNLFQGDTFGAVGTTEFPDLAKGAHTELTFKLYDWASSYHKSYSDETIVFQVSFSTLKLMHENI